MNAVKKAAAERGVQGPGREGKDLNGSHASQDGRGSSQHCDGAHQKNQEAVQCSLGGQGEPGAGDHGSPGETLLSQKLKASAALAEAKVQFIKASVGTVANIITANQKTL
jgi:hypothetical protein